jgi:outer membrane protein assembly factor BamB
MPRMMALMFALVLLTLAAFGCDDGDLVGPPESGKPLWKEPIGHRASDPVTDGRHVIMSWPGGVGALDAQTGDVLWEFDVAFLGFAHPAFVMVEDVVMVSWVGVLRGLSADQGVERWSNSNAPTEWTGIVGEGGATDALATDGVGAVYVANTVELARIEPETGGILWRARTEGNGRVALAAGSEAVCVRRAPIVTVACYSLADGRLLWSIGQLDVSARGGIAVVGDRVVVQVDFESVGLDAETGREAWRTSALPLVDWSTDHPDGVLYGCTEAEGCIAVRASDGEVLWRSTVASLWPPAATSRHVFVNAREEDAVSLYVLDALSGQIVDRILPEERESFVGRLSYGDGILIVRTFDDVRAYRYP